MKIGTSKTAERNKDARATSNSKKSGMRATHVKNDDDKITIEEEQELDTKLSPTTSAADYRRMCKGMSLCVAYAANIGGTGSLSGTSTNLIMQGQAQGLFQEYGLDSGVNFTTWMIFALPGSVICVILAWLWLTLLFFGPKEWIRRRQRDKVKDALVKETILREYQKLGPVSFAEKVVMGHFIVLVCLWLSRNPPMVPGWGSLFPPKFVGDSAAAILIALSLFVFPAECPQVFFWKRHAGGVKPRPVRSVLDWKTVQTNYPWGVLVLLGGGYALAHTCEVSGLSRWIGQELTVLAYLAPWQLSLALCAIIAMATEVTSNAATASLLLPILGQLAVNLNMNPLYLLFPCAISASFAFMLPVATPPNTIVFATGHLEVKDMVIAGSVLNVVCVLVVSLAANTWGMAYFKLDTLPPGFGAAVPNMTSMATTLGADALYNYTTGGDSFISAFSNVSETPNAAYSVLNISGSL
ncbi:hypothetical protein V1264_024937 [Littorina saxatilis]|uniref:Uncharacterized protein n=2 Tax=Littorina saxatilis TaxID=31220 RepID=A0AAN9FY88_9CAEN